MYIVSKNIDFHFIKFPILFPLIYGLVLFLLPNYEQYLIFLTILLLAEPHFGATWPFLFGKNYKEFVYKKKKELVIIPILIIIFSLSGYFFFTPFFLLVFYAANIYHVTRQSFGVCKLYVKDKLELDYYEILIYFFNFLFFLIGFLRFYLNIINDNHIFIMNVLLLVLLTIVVINLYLKFRNFQNILTFLTGCIIFYPIAFVENPVHAIIMGVTMHYTQYLVLTNKVTLRRFVHQNQIAEAINFSFLNNKYFLTTIIIYSLFMTFFAILNKYKLEYSYLIIIPIIGQFLHFYLDSQLWKFSEKYNRENVLKYLLS